MQLKTYQQTVIDDLSRFLGLLSSVGNIPKAYTKFWEEHPRQPVAVGFNGLSQYQNNIAGVPNVCLKVPTGGGKTFIAACALKPIFDSLGEAQSSPEDKIKAVVWLVPSDAILSQTEKNLSNPNHYYNVRLRTDFTGGVTVYTKQQLLDGKNFSPVSVSEQLSVFVLSYDSFRTSKKDGRKAYQQNGNLAAFADYFKDPDIALADTDETALINVIRNLNPVVIVDESHHATSTLSKEMLTNFNPSFILDLTATPKKDANIISFVDALQLKHENMVKLPVIVYNRRKQSDVFADAITIRNKLEREAANAERYIRPIALFQAEPRNNADSTTFERVKKHLLDLDIPEEQIAIKTGDKDELKKYDLLSPSCPIRYIITVNALKEGWDCPFAYVLATIANRSSAVDVEQILGRILRLPYTSRNASNRLNISYVITSSDDFQRTLDKVVVGLNNAGFSEQDYFAPELPLAPEVPTPKPVQDTFLPEVPPSADDEPFFTDEEKEEIKARIVLAENDSDNINAADELFAVAEKQATDYEKIAEENTAVSIPPEVREKMNIFRVNAEFADEVKTLRLPQFVLPLDIPMLTNETTAPLTKEDLSAIPANFELRDKDARIDFATIEAEIAQVDLSEGKDSLPKAWKLSGFDNQYYREWFNTLPAEKRIAQCKDIILKLLAKINGIDNGDLERYIERVIAGLTAEQLDELQQAPHSYFLKIKHKIDTLLLAHREETFDLWLEQGRITCEELYAFPETIAPLRFTKTLSRTLYSAEEEMNGLERDVAWELSNMANIKWWHRNIARTGFNINGYVNAYPDIIAMTQSGKILLIEPKGDHLENAESRQKVKIGRAWEKHAGKQYRYYMVFRDKSLGVDGAVRFDRLIEIVRGV
jgi:type III restriction enzyme